MIKWVGTDKLDAKFKQALRDAPQKAASALYLEAEKIMGESKRLVPVDTGRLRASGHVKQPQINGSKVGVEMAYATDYAVYVHEITTNRHPSGQAKFLEQPLMAALSGMESRLAARMADIW